MNTANLWVLKTVHDEDKANKTVDSYEDSLSEYYNYDNNVANSKNIKENDYAIIIDKKAILGFSKIGFIDQYDGNKTIRKCPVCEHSTIDKRKTKLPPYRCNNGHEFDQPTEEIQSVKKYSASFSHFISIKNYNNNLNQLRPYYINGYNRNMSMQLLSLDALNLFDKIEERLNTVVNNLKILPTTSYTNEEENIPDVNNLNEEKEVYDVNNLDERDTVIKAIKARRGQQTFRKNLLDIYNSTCVISGCKIIDILEAAHISPYRGEKDNHVSNGLLLRADIHTLFDLDLIQINPENYLVEISDKLIGSEYEQYNGLSLEQYNDLISKDALRAKRELYS